MALSPEIEPFMDDDELESEEIMTSRDFRIDLETGRLTSGIVTGLEAIKQFVALALMTPRFDYAIYSADFGSEVEELMYGDSSISYKESEIERMVIDALIHDERIDSVHDFIIETKNDGLYVSCKVESVEGLFELEEVFGGES